MPTVYDTFLAADGTPHASMSVVIRSMGTPVETADGLGSLSVLIRTTNASGELTQELNPGTYRLEWRSGTAWNQLDIEVPEGDGPYRAGAIAAALGPVLREKLLAWTLAESWTLGSVEYDADGILATATITWPNGAPGVLTVTAVYEIDGEPSVPNAFTVTHVLGGVTTTVTQPAITRDNEGAVLIQPTPILS